MKGTNEYRQLKFVLKIDKELNAIYFRNESDSSLIKEAILADLKKSRQFQSKSFTQINVNKSHIIANHIQITYSIASDHCIQIRNLGSKKCVAKLDPQIWYDTYCLENLDENQFASVSEDNTIKIWSTKTFDCLKTIESHKNRVFCLKSCLLYTSPSPRDS